MNGDQTFGLQVLLCKTCARHVTPPRFTCPHCGGDALVSDEVEGRGRVVSTTTIRRAPTRFRADAPYVIAVVELACGVRITGRAMPGTGDLPVGQAVTLATIRNDIPYFRS